VAGKSGISQARTRLGVEPVKRLHDETVGPIASKSTRGAWYREWRLASLDGSTLDVADTKENEGAFGRPGASRGSSAYPRIRFVSLVENGTHVLFGSRMGDYQTGEITLAKELAAPMRSGLGNRERIGRTQDPSARVEDSPAFKDAGVGATRVLWSHDGALCCTRADARSGAQGGHRPG